MLLSTRQPSALDDLGIKLEDLCSGTLVTGTTGSGKTSLLRLLLHDLYGRGVGAVHCCVKKDEAENARTIIEATPMKDRLLMLAPNRFTYNFCAFEILREGGSPATLCRLFTRLSNILTRTQQSSSESFWEQLFRDFTLHATWISWLASRDRITPQTIHAVVTSCPATIEQVKSPQFLASPCMKLLRQAQHNVSTPEEARSLSQATEFFLKTATQIGERARGAALQQVTSLLSPFLRSPLFEICCSSGPSTFTPDDVLDGHMAVLDVPLPIHSEQGLLLQNIVVMQVMEACLRRSNPENLVAIVRDEAQWLIADPEFDMMVQSVARSHRLACISSVQNLPLVKSAFGGDLKAESYLNGLIANYNTRFVLQNICRETNQTWADVFGQFKDHFTSTSENHHQPNPESGFEAMLQKPFTFSTSQQMNYRIQPDEFTRLRRGGPDNNWLIDFYLAQGGRQFDNGECFKLMTISQR